MERHRNFSTKYRKPGAAKLSTQVKEHRSHKWKAGQIWIHKIFIISEQGRHNKIKRQARKWYEIFLMWWLIFIANLIGSRDKSLGHWWGTSLGVPVRAFPLLINGGVRCAPKSRQCHSMSWGPKWETEKKVIQAVGPTSFCFLIHLVCVCVCVCPHIHIHRNGIFSVIYKPWLSTWLDCECLGDGNTYSGSLGAAPGMVN